MLNYNALLLDSGYLPIQVLDWKKAMTLYFTGRAEVVELHENIHVQSTHKKFPLPKVLRLVESFKAITRVKFNRYNVFLRDKFQCQYCEIKFTQNELSLDHVLPRSRGGKSDWSNIVTSCNPCNNKKADKTPKEARMNLKRAPYEPSWNPFYSLRLSKKDMQAFGHWLIHKVSA